MTALNLALEQTAERVVFWADQGIVCDDHAYPKEGADLYFLAGVQFAFKVVVRTMPELCITL